MSLFPTSARSETGVSGARNGTGQGGTRSLARACCDAGFVVCAALWAWACLQGIVDLSLGGIMLDSDLGTYAQGMAARAHPECFVNDVVLRNVTHHNSIWNVQTTLATWLAPEGGFATGLLRSGAVGIFFYLVFWYGLGRVLYARPSLALLLVAFQCITCWVGWGTFWGVFMDDPVPRVWYAGLWPLIVLGTLHALPRPKLRPLVLLFCGLSVWVHSISALTAGAMTFLAFFLARSPGTSLARHLGTCLAGLVCFLVPVFCFLWPTLSDEHVLSSADLATLGALFRLRYAADYHAPLATLWTFLHTYILQVPLIPLGLAGLVLVARRGTARLKHLSGLYGPFVLAMALVVAFSFAEGFWARQQGHMPLGHELVRGARFLIPLCWLAIVAGFACLVDGRPLLRRATALAAVVAVLILAPDRQLLAGLHAVHLSAINVHSARMVDYAERGRLKARALAALEACTRPGDVIFCNEPEPAIRYQALRGLVYSFKDGANAFYDRDVARARQWLHYTALFRETPTGYVTAWLESGTPWLLTSRMEDRDLLEGLGTLVYSSDLSDASASGGWLLVRRNPAQGAGRQASPGGIP